MTEIVVIFATPTLDHRVCLEFMKSMIETEWLLGPAGIAHGYKQVAGDCFIAKARNRLVTEFLLEFPMATDLFFLDDDIGWPAQKVIDFLRRPEAVVAGVYPKKTETPEYAVDLEIENGDVIESDGLYRAISAPTGFMRIKRKVLEDLAEGAPTYMEQDENNIDRIRYSIFECGLHTKEKRWWGEDYAFCQKWRQRGGHVWVDPDIKFTHRGNRVWTGTFRDMMMPRLAAWKEAQRAKVERNGQDIAAE